MNVWCNADDSRFFSQHSHTMHAPARKQCVRSADCAKGRGEQCQSAQRLGWDIFCYSHERYVLLLTNLFMVILIDLLGGLILPSSIEGLVLIVTTRQKNLQFHPILATDKHLMSYLRCHEELHVFKMLNNICHCTWIHHCVIATRHVPIMLIFNRLLLNVMLISYKWVVGFSPVLIDFKFDRLMCQNIYLFLIAGFIFSFTFSVCLPEAFTHFWVVQS